MSGLTGSKINIRGSGRVAKLGTDGQGLTSAGAGVAAAFEDLVGGLSWQAVETGSTMTAEAGKAYWVNTTSNACTITLPASASNGDTIIFADYARTWGTNGIVIDSNGLNYQGDDDTFDVEYTTDGQSVQIVYSDATQGWIPISDEAVANVPSIGNSEGIFAYGDTNSIIVSLSNKVSNTGVVATDVTGVGTDRCHGAATEYGGDKGIFAFGFASGGTVNISLSNLVSTAGVVGTDVSGVGTARRTLAACSYSADKDKGIFGFGYVSGVVSMTNLVSNAGVVATDVAGVGTARSNPGATEYGGDKGIFAYGGGPVSISNLVSNVGVVATDTAGVGTARFYMAACSYAGDKGIFGYGDSAGGITGVTNLVSNVGVVATDVTGVGTARYRLGACEYGGGKGIFAYGNAGPSGYAVLAMSNLVSTTGVVATDVAGVGTARAGLSACSYN